MVFLLRRVALLIGPVFAREVAIAPRRVKIYVARTTYVLALLVLIWTAWLVLTGTQLVRDVGDLARFATAMFQILAPLQLALAAFFSALLAASEVAHEKDRKTLILLLLTRLSNCELVLGKLLASLLSVLVMLAAALPVFLLTALLGGVSYGQIARAFAVTLATALVCGSLGSTLALWREKTFQALAMTVLVLVLWLAVGEIIAAGVLGESIAGLPCQALAAGMSPWQAILEAARPYVHDQPALGRLGTPVYLFLADGRGDRLLLNGVAVAMVRVWNPSREGRGEREEGRGRRESGRRRMEFKCPLVRQLNCRTDLRSVSRLSHLSPFPLPPSSFRNPPRLGQSRDLAGNPHLGLRAEDSGGAAGVSGDLRLGRGGLYVHARRRRRRSRRSLVLVPLVLLSLVLVNAQAVTSLDQRARREALDLLLVTDLTPKEIVYGKLGGVFYNTKEMVLLPMLLCVGLWLAGTLSWKTCCILLGGLAVLYVFAAMLGPARRNDLRQLGRGHRHQPGHAVLPLPRRRRVHADHDGLQRLVQRAVSAVLRLHGVRRRGALRGAGAPQSLVGHRRGVVPLPDRHVLRHHQLSDRAALSAGDVPGDLGRLRLHRRRHARAGDLRVRRGHRPDHARRMSSRFPCVRGLPAPRHGSGHPAFVPL